MHTIQDVERERQRPFAQLLADLAEEGLSMRKAAIVLDVNREAVRRYVEKLGDESPRPGCTRPARRWRRPPAGWPIPTRWLKQHGLSATEMAGR